MGAYSTFSRAEIKFALSDLSLDLVKEIIREINCNPYAGANLSTRGSKDELIMSTDSVRKPYVLKAMEEVLEDYSPEDFENGCEEYEDDESEEDDEEED